MVQWILLMPQVRAQQIGCAQAINGDFCGHSLHASLLLPLAINAWLCGLSHGLRSTARLQNATPAQNILSYGVSASEPPYASRRAKIKSALGRKETASRARPARKRRANT